eukprot:CAMPEP_0184496816 /NCGR_PEP_ID=MMETSP0113_2-20130426/34951_1 /TAXON_ID=91329 /ORGANISM="Norrisiella sphaerica, Strain BC52" /LENGTH=788 /DNA_ID=CAMNT_0026883625 /DNA_START=107 /DNA_END=2470 /DNA_ORIENTATION=+
MSAKRKNSVVFSTPTPTKRARSATDSSGVGEIPMGLQNEIKILQYEKRHISQRLIMAKRANETTEKSVLKLRRQNKELMERVSMMETHWNQVIQDINSILRGDAASNLELHQDTKDYLKKLVTIEDDDEKGEKTSEQRKWIEKALKKKRDVTKMSLEKYLAAIGENAGALDLQSQVQTLKVRELKATQALEQLKVDVSRLQQELDQERYRIRELEVTADVNHKQSIRAKEDLKVVKDALETSKRTIADLSAKKRAVLSSSAGTTSAGGPDSSSSNPQACSPSTKQSKSDGQGASDGDIVDLKILEEKADMLRKEVADLSARNTELQLRLKQLPEDDVKETQCYKNLKNDYYVLTEEYKLKKAELQVSLKAREGLHQHLLSQRKVFEDLKGRLKEKVVRQVAGLVDLKCKAEKGQVKKAEARIKILEEKLEASLRANARLEESQNRQAKKMEKMSMDLKHLDQVGGGSLSWRVVTRQMSAKIKQLEQTLSGVKDGGKRPGTSTQAELEHKIKSLEKELETFRENSELSNLKEELESSQELQKALEEEINGLEAEFGEMERENKNLSRKVEELENKAVNDFIEEKFKLKQQISIIEREKEAIEAKHRAEKQKLVELQQKNEEWKKLEAEQNKRILLLTRETDELKFKDHALTVEASRAVAERDTLKSMKEEEKDIIKGLKKQLAETEEKRLSLDREVTNLQRKLSKHSRKNQKKADTSTDDGDDLYRYMYEEERKKTRCTVCSKNDINVIILQCQHMFCRECIEKNLKVRNRKCPKCTLKYSEKEVKDIW